MYLIWGGYSNIDIHVDQFKAMRISTSGTLSISQRDYGVMGMASLYQPHLSYPIDLYLDESSYSEYTPLEYSPFTETSAYIIGETANYWSSFEEDNPFKELTDELLTITFTNIAESIYLNNREVYAVNNIGRCSGYIQNNAAGDSQLVFTDVDCQLTYDEINKWCILMDIGLPMWENISIYITDLTIELRT